LEASFLSLEGKKALITGACRGIGRAIAVLFAEAGADVVLSCRNQAHLEEVAGEIRKTGRIALPVAAHVRKVEDLENLFAKAREQFGAIDILVNNAATNPAMGPLVDMDGKVYDQIMDTNLKGYTVLSQLVGKLMRDSGGGNIINISSVGGITPGKGLGLYCISKAAVIMLTRVLAVELGAYNIRVNAIAPGIVKTRFSEALWSNKDLLREVMSRLPLKRLSEPEEVARIALFLASEASAMVTGQTIVMDGGGSL